MKFHLLPIFTFLTLVLAVTRVASSPPEVYWKATLAATPMPKSIKDILPTGGEKPAFAAVNTKGDDIPNTRYFGEYQRSYAVAKPQSHGEHQMAHIFFLEKDLRPGSELDFSLINGTSTTAKFWPRQLGIADGTKVKAVAIYHRDTSKWNPMHFAFQELKVKPGTNSICHFLSEDNVVWVSN